jgi:eukaryotic-like serine/threonine-protein kinase
MVGGVIGNYRILRGIGEGGMGAVYIAEHALIGRQAAIKVLLREMSSRPDVVTRFFNEARAASAVRHPGIVEIYDFGYHTDGSAYIVMEYLEGESLALRLQHTGTLFEMRAAALCRQVAGALGAAHAKGIVHRDLKPDNIYIVRDPDIIGGERIKILDFGIAKLAAAGDLPGQSVTRTGSVIGTPPYMSPEQCKGAGNVDHRADLYALGCVLFEMVCGRAPFLAEGGGEIMAQHIYAVVPQPSSIRPVTPQLEQVILHALAKEPSQRFQSADEMIAALHSAVPSGTVHASMTEPMSSEPVSPALPVPAAVIAIAPQMTTLSHASAATSVLSSAEVGGRSWWVPAIAAVAIAVGAAAITLGVRRGERDAPMATAPEPTGTPSAAPPERRPAPLPTSEATAPGAPGRPSSPSMVTTPPPPQAAPKTHARVSARIIIKLTSDPSGADVYRMPSGVLIGTTPLDYTIDAGNSPIALTFKKPGYSDKPTSVPTDRHSEHKITLATLAAKGPPPAASATRTGSASGSADAPRASGSLNPFEELGPKKRRDQ